MNLHYKQYGQGAPVIILHGLFGTLDNWQHIARHLASDFMVYTIDQRNHGRSPHSETHDYRHMAEDLRQFMEEHWMFRASVVGHSMGGKTAMQFALDHPDMVEKLVVIDIAPKKYSGNHQEIFEALFSLDLNNIQTRQEAEQQLAHRIKDAGVRLFLMKNLTRRPEGGFEFKMNLPVLYRHYKDILDAVKGDLPCEAPTLFVTGGRSQYFIPGDEVLIRQLFPNATFQTIRNAGHWVHADAPEELIGILRNFLK